MRFAECGAARHGGADRRRDRGVKEIDIQRDMQHALRRADRVEELAQGGHDAPLVQNAHVVDGKVVLQQGRMFRRIDRSDAVKADAFGRDLDGKGRKGVKAVAPGDIGDRGAVQIARGRGQRRVEIAVGVQPQQKQRPVRAGGIGGSPRNRAQRQRVVAAEDDRQAALRQGVVNLVAQNLRPAQHFGQGVNRRIGAGGSGQVRQGDVAPVLHRMTQFAHRCGQTRDTVGGRAHHATGAALAVVDGGADQDDVGHGISFSHTVFPACGKS